MSLSGVQR